jgi:hypothetical protein
MPETSIVKKIYKWKRFTRRPGGKPKSRWEDHLKWKDIVEKAKSLSEL